MVNAFWHGFWSVFGLNLPLPRVNFVVDGRNLEKESTGDLLHSFSKLLAVTGEPELHIRIERTHVQQSNFITSTKRILIKLYVGEVLTATAITEPESVRDTMEILLKSPEVMKVLTGQTTAA